MNVCVLRVRVRVRVRVQLVTVQKELEQHSPASIKLSEEMKHLERRRVRARTRRAASCSLPQRDASKTGFRRSVLRQERRHGRRQAWRTKGVAQEKRGKAGVARQVGRWCLLEDHSSTSRSIYPSLIS
eukprot:5289546-Pleurochrysis_carterae.AAC.1